MYEFDSRVRYSEVDHHGTMTVPALINYFAVPSSRRILELVQQF